MADTARLGNKLIERMSRVKGETLVAIIAGIPVSFYIIAFSFETGFFWDVGFGFLPAFSVGEHLVHAGTYAIAVIIIVPILITMILPQAMIEHYYKLPEPHVYTEAFSHRKSSRLKRLFILVCTMPIPLLSLKIIYGLVIELLHRFELQTAFFASFCTWFGLYVFERVYSPQTRWAQIPLVLVIVLAVPAFGSLQYHRLEQEKDGSRVTIRVGHKSITGNMLFGGSSRILIAVHGSVCLLDNEGKSIISIASLQSGVQARIVSDCELVPDNDWQGDRKEFRL